MAWGDLPKVKIRKWVKHTPGFLKRHVAVYVAAHVRKDPTIAKVRLVKETRWVVKWKKKGGVK